MTFIKPASETFRTIMGNGRSYTIPSFQRDYSWGDDQLQELWQDILRMQKNKSHHFMGYLVFESKDQKDFRIIDGQQRLTALSFLILVILAEFKKKIEKGEDTENNEKRRKSYFDTYMGVRNMVSLETSPKLILNRNNNPHFEDMKERLGILRQRSITTTNRRLNRTFEFFQKELSLLALSGSGLADILETIIDGLFFVTINVENDLNAYLVFETLNARGIHLSAPDLFKNYLLSTLAGEDGTLSVPLCEKFEEGWTFILNQLGETKFISFLRSYIGMSDQLPSKKELYIILREKVTKYGDVMPYLEAIKAYAPIYAALQNSQDDFWKNYGGGQYHNAIPYLETLNLFNIKTPLSLLMTTYRVYQEEPCEFIKILKWITIISIRYNVICSKPSKEQEILYNKLACIITKDKQLNDKHYSEFLKIYPKDDEFKRAFCDKTMATKSSNKKALFLLCAIEKQARNDGDEQPINLTLEHVLPCRPDTAWQDVFGLNTYSDAIDRLGNMAILPKNKNMGQESFIEKKKILSKSRYCINKKIAEYDQWNIKNLNTHQEWLAEKASATWRISELDSIIRKASEYHS